MAAGMYPEADDHWKLSEEFSAGSIKSTNQPFVWAFLSTRQREFVLKWCNLRCTRRWAKTRTWRCAGETNTRRSEESVSLNQFYKLLRLKTTYRSNVNFQDVFHVLWDRCEVRVGTPCCRELTHEDYDHVWRQEDAAPRHFTVRLQDMVRYPVKNIDIEMCTWGVGLHVPKRIITTPLPQLEIFG